MPESLQNLVDRIAQELNASIVISSRELKSWVASAQGEDIDAVRTISLIQRRTPSESRAYVESFGIDSAYEPFIIPSSEKLEILGRVCVPLRHGEAVAFVWLIPNHGTLEQLLERLQQRNIAAEFIEAFIAEGWGSFGGTFDTDTVDVETVLAAPRASQERIWTSMLDTTTGGEVAITFILSALENVIEPIFEAIAKPPRMIRSITGKVHGGTAIICSYKDLDTLLRILLELCEEGDGIGVATHPVKDRLTKQLLERIRYAAIVSSIPLSHRPVGYLDRLGHWNDYYGNSWTLRTLSDTCPEIVSIATHTNPDLLETLKVYLDVNGEVAECCKRLHIHRTTLHYRLRRLRPFLGELLDSGTGRADLIRGLSILELINSPYTM